MSPFECWLHWDSCFCFFPSRTQAYSIGLDLGSRPESPSMGFCALSKWKETCARWTIGLFRFLQRFPAPCSQTTTCLLNGSPLACFPQSSHLSSGSLEQLEALHSLGFRHLVEFLHFVWVFSQISSNERMLGSPQRQEGFFWSNGWLDLALMASSEAHMFHCSCIHSIRRQKCRRFRSWSNRSISFGIQTSCSCSPARTKISV